MRRPFFIFKNYPFIQYTDNQIFLNFLDKSFIDKIYNDFWLNIQNDLKKDQSIMTIMIKIKFKNDVIRSLTNLNHINNKMKDELYEEILFQLDFRTEDYQDYELESVIFMYHIENNSNIKSNIDKKNRNKNEIPKYIEIKNNKFPSTTNLSKWGEIIENKDNFYIINHPILKYNLKYYITVFNDRQEIVLRKNMKSIILKWINYLGKDENNFIIKTNNKEVFIENNKVVLSKQNLDCKFMTKNIIHKNIINKFITLDIETIINEKGFHIPYLISYYDGKNIYSFFKNDYINEQEMIKACLNSIFIRKYNGYKIYCHNLASFDGIFLLNTLSSISNINIKPIIKDNQIFQIKININNYNFEFKDSLKMLPLSLRNLAKAFKVENEKCIFPYKLNDINYVGDVPDFKYFDNLSYLDYTMYFANFLSKQEKWSFKEESIKYCEMDCISLYQVINKFNILIFDKYSINIHKYLTLPSLTMNIFKIHYLKNNTVPIITGECFKFIKHSYTGGHTDVYKPYSSEPVITIDVNSLYPYTMKEFDVPIGKPIYFEGDITKFSNLEDLFGFFECDIKSPENLKRPTLMTKIKTKFGFRTIAPLGNWTDIIFSEELKYNLKIGYKFNIRRGYLFEKGIIFKEMIDDLYKIKESYNKNDPMFLIAKLLMNSLYGKFGMDENLPLHKILSNEQINIFKNNNNIIISDITTLSNNKTLIQYTLPSYTNNRKKDISVGIASSITANSRIYMNEFLINNLLDVLYIDTDAIHIPATNIKYILKTFLDNKVLGKFKIEYSMKEATYLAPKVYGGILTETNEELVKVKGFKNKISYSLLKSVLIKDSKVILEQDKWFKNLYQNEINVKESLYTLQITDSKRKLIYDNNNVFCDTTPFKINKDKEIINK